MSQITILKQQAAEFAVNNFVNSGMIIGLGEGSTAIFALYYIGELLEQGRLSNISGIASSVNIEIEAKKHKIPLLTINEVTFIDLTIDGADEVDPDLNLIKGGGGALLREKEIAKISKREIIVVDESKLSKKLGAKWAVPVEIIPSSQESLIEYLSTLGAEPALRKTISGDIYYTEHGNKIIDAYFGPIDDLSSLSLSLDNRTGIVEHGLFLDLATDLIIGSEKGIEHISKQALK